MYRQDFHLQTLTVFGPAISSFYKLVSHSCGKACRNLWLFPIIQACFTLMWQSLPKRLASDPKWKNRKSDIFDTVKFGSGHVEQSCSSTFQNQHVSTLFWSSCSVVRYIDTSTISFSLHRKTTFRPPFVKSLQTWTLVAVQLNWNLFSLHSHCAPGSKVVLI